jgi:hypothetical protein
MTNFKMMFLNLICGTAIVIAIVIAIVSLQKCSGALCINVLSEIQEERCKKSLSTSLTPKGL